MNYSESGRRSRQTDRAGRDARTRHRLPLISFRNVKNSSCTYHTNNRTFKQTRVLLLLTGDAAAAVRVTTEARPASLPHCGGALHSDRTIVP